MGVSLLECMRGGVTDVRLPSASTTDADNVNDAGPGATGVMSVIGPFQVDRFVAIVMRREPAMVSTTVDADTRFILAQPWSIDHMANAAARHRSFAAACPVELNRIHIAGLPTLFSVVSGRHRAFTAREHGDLAIDAHIHADLYCEASAFEIDGSTLTRDFDGEHRPVAPAQSWGGSVPSEDAALPVDVVQILQALGCPMAAGMHLAAFELAGGSSATTRRPE